MTEALVKREIQNGQLQVQNPSPLTRWQKTRAFCRGLIRGRPLVEVSCRALEKGGLTEGEQFRHLERIARRGTPEQAHLALARVSMPENDELPVAGGPYRGTGTALTIPETLQQRLAERFVKSATLREKRYAFYNDVYENHWFMPLICPLSKCAFPLFSFMAGIGAFLTISGHPVTQSAIQDAVFMLGIPMTGSAITFGLGKIWDIAEGRDKYGLLSHYQNSIKDEVRTLLADSSISESAKATLASGFGFIPARALPAAENSPATTAIPEHCEAQ